MLFDVLLKLLLSKSFDSQLWIQKALNGALPFCSLFAVDNSIWSLNFNKKQFFGPNGTDLALLLSFTARVASLCSFAEV